MAQAKAKNSSTAKSSSKASNNQQRIVLIVFVAVFALTGVYFLTKSKAAGIGCYLTAVTTGQSGECVRNAQIIMRSMLRDPAYNAQIPKTGTFDPKTKALTLQFQQTWNRSLAYVSNAQYKVNVGFLPENGYLAPPTWRAMCARATTPFAGQKMLATDANYNEVITAIGRSCSVIPATSVTGI